MLPMRYLIALIAAGTGIAGSAMAEGTGVTIYARTNCFIFKAADGNTLFERSGGGSATINQTVRGVLDDFGYQQIKDASGRELMVGFVDNFGVTDQVEIDNFKKNCR